jgi:hypothetical protein
MIQPVTQARWQEAQVAEVLATTYENPGNAREAYAKIFRYLGMEFDQKGKYIIEVGCGAFPAVSFCDNVKPTIVEPLRFPQLAKYAEESDAEWIGFPLEDINTYSFWEFDELWMFNCIQHVRDPELFIEKCKELATTIRFFEPVDYPTCVYHPHTFNQADFERWFGDCVKRYTDRLEQFFDGDCVYGTWRK